MAIQSKWLKHKVKLAVKLKAIKYKKVSPTAYSLILSIKFFLLSIL